MRFNYNGVKVNFNVYGKQSERVVLLLHGWGRSGEDFKALINQFPERCFLAVDFPPFGKSDKNLVGWSIYTYAQMVMSLCEHLKIKSVDIIGHSFGGRVGILISALECSFVHSCILVDSAGMKPKRSIKYRWRVCKYKLCKKFGKSTLNQGSSDYLALSPEMKKTFVGVVNTFLEDYARTILSPTLIVWGKNDQETPLYMAKRLKKLIKTSSLKIIDDGGHFAFMDNPLQFYGLVKAFWEGN